MGNDLNLLLGDDLMISPIIDRVVETLTSSRERLLEAKSDDLTILMVSTQLNTLIEVKRLIHERNKRMCMQLADVVDKDYPIEMKQKFVDETMAFSQI